MKQATNKEKMSIINFIDMLNERLEGSIYGYELKKIRNKYIYKDISTGELFIDYKNLCCYEDIIKNNR